MPTSEICWFGSRCYVRVCGRRVPGFYTSSAEALDFLVDYLYGGSF
jgi:hypothetical protein